MSSSSRPFGTAPVFRPGHGTRGGSPRGSPCGVPGSSSLDPRGEAPTSGPEVRGRWMRGDEAEDPITSVALSLSLSKLFALFSVFFLVGRFEV